MTEVEIPCPAGGECTYVTPKLPAASAVELLAMHERIAHGSNASAVVNVKPEKFPRPNVGLDEPIEKWEDFSSSWQQYKEEYCLSGKKLTRQLIACCSPDLATSLSRVSGGKHFDLDETDILKQMKNLVVRFENPAVHVQTFLAMHQQPEEGVRHFLARLRGVANHCEFRVRCSCTHEVSYADNVIKYKLVAGLVDEEIKEDVLGTTDLDLEATIKMIEGKEGAKKAKQSLSQSFTGQVSQVGKVKLRKCTHCGRSGHQGSSTDREKHCPAYDKTCNNCGKKGHFRKKCLSKKVQQKEKKHEQSSDEKEEEDADANVVDVMHVVAGVTKNVHSDQSWKVPHMVHSNGAWVECSPPSHPKLNVTLSVAVDGYKRISKQAPPATRRRTAEVNALADSGCQACCMGVRQMNALGLQMSDLIKPKLMLKAANTTGMEILGEVFVEVMISQERKTISTGIQ